MRSPKTLASATRDDDTHRSLLVASLLAALTCPACTFPSVEIADGGGDPSSDAGACGGLDGCTGAAKACAAAADAAHTTCLQQCSGNKKKCDMGCDTTQGAALSGCEATCSGCAPGCAGAPAACRTAAGL